MSLRHQLIEFAQCGNVSAIKTLLKQAEVSSEELSWPLQKAVLQNQYRAVKLLIEQGAAIDSLVEGSTALIEASKQELYKIIKLLLKSGANVDCQDTRGQSAITYTTQRKTVKLLKKYRVDFIIMVSKRGRI